MFRTKGLITFLLASLLTAPTYAETVWVDVRSAIENSLDSIQGDIRIDHDEIVENITSLYPDKDTEINLYCRSGNRAGKALEALKKAGYTKVTNTGGIDEAREIRNISD